MGYCLADLFNLRLWRTGRPPNFGDVRDGLDELVTASLSASPALRELTVRLYGGWHGDVPDTRVGLRDMVMRATDQAVKRQGGVRLRYELADTPNWDKSLRLLRSVRVARQSHLSLKVDHPADDCSSVGNCSLLHFAGWCRGRCPKDGCPVRLSAVAWTHGQKMVDTLLTADAIFIGANKDTDVVLVASDDEDMIPALLALTTLPVSVVHLVRGSALPPYYDGIFELKNVTIHRW